MKTNISEERELLRRVLNHVENLPPRIHYAIVQVLGQPEQTKQDLILEWYKKGYKQGFVDGQDVTDMILGEGDE